MPKVTFTGDPRAPGTDPQALTMHGVAFPFGVAVEASDEIAAKLSSHSHFAVEVAGSPKGYRAVHKGRGKFAIVFGDEDEQIVTDLTKADAAAFNALPAEEQAAFVAK
jgi:hypothetical protein